MVPPIIITIIVNNAKRYLPYKPWLPLPQGSLATLRILFIALRTELISGAGAGGIGDDTLFVQQ